MVAVLLSVGSSMVHGATQSTAAGHPAVIGSAVPEVVAWVLALCWIVGNLCALEFVAALRKNRQASK
jgi:hypothetical protein